MRLFVALELPQGARAALAAFRDRADPAIWRPVPDAALHITLAFLGNRPDGDETTISAVLHSAVATAGAPAPALALGGGLLLPPRRPRVLCAEVSDPTGALAALQSAVSAGLEAAGLFEPEQRRFRAHATVARLRPGARAPRSIEVAPEPVAFAGGPLTLFASRLHPHGARYEPLVRVSLT